MTTIFLTVVAVHIVSGITSTYQSNRCFIMPPPLIVVMVSDVSVAYIGPKSRTERPRKTKIGIEVDHVTRDSVKVTRLLHSQRH